MPKNKIAFAIFILCFMLGLDFQLKAQKVTKTESIDTLNLDLKGIQKMFLDSNLQLLAQHYNILSSKALVEQARKWDNPQLSTNQNLYNSQEGFFKHGTVYDAQGNANLQGEIYADVEQLIKTAGKRKKQIEIAKTNVSIAEVQFEATMRSLRLTLLTDFYTIIQLAGTAELYQDNMQRLDKLIDAMQIQLAKGDIAKKEFLRVQALRIALQQNITDNNNSIEQTESEIKTILRLRGNIYVKPILNDMDLIGLPDYSLIQILDSARMHNTDYKAEKYQVQLQNNTLKLQKALAVPDVTVGIDMDQHSTYVPYYTGINIGLPLPIWDRNQGNIKSAKNLLAAEETNMKEVELKLENDVMTAYKKLLNVIKLHSNNNKQFYADYFEIFRNITEAFNKRQISLLEFLDYFTDYESTKQQLLQQEFNLRAAKAGLNDVVGIDICK